MPFSLAKFLAALIAIILASVPPVTIWPDGFSRDKNDPIIFSTSSSISLVPLNRPGSPRLESKNLLKTSLAIGCASVHMEPNILPSEYLQSKD